MYITNVLLQTKQDDSYIDDVEEHPEHYRLNTRLKKSLYYCKLPGTDRPSLPLSEVAVEYFRDAATKELGRVDLYFASNVGRKAYVSPTSLMASMLYVNRLRNRNPDYLQQISSSDLFLISMLVASKYLYDEGTDEEVYNDEWADAANMDIKDLNELEKEFLTAVDWNLFVNDEEFSQLLQRIEAKIAWTEGCRRGNFTYTDFLALSNKLLDYQHLMEITSDVVKVVLVCSVAYFTGVLALAAAPHAHSFALARIPHFNTEQSSKVNLGLTNAMGKVSGNEEHESMITENTTSPPNRDYRAKDDHDSVAEFSLSHLVNFMALVSETFNHLLKSHSWSHDRYTEVNDLSSPGVHNGWKCECGTCGIKSSDQCHNVTIWENEVEPESSIWTCQCLQRHSSTGVKQSCYEVRSCCCCPYGTLPPLNRMFPDVIVGFHTQIEAVG